MKLDHAKNFLKLAGFAFRKKVAAAEKHSRMMEQIYKVDVTSVASP